MLVPPLPHPIPLFLDLSACRVLLVGGGPLAEAKLAPLRAAGAAIRSVAERHEDCFVREALRLGGVERIKGPFQVAQLEGVRLVISATADRALNARVADEARQHGLFCHAVDDPGACDAFFAASFRRGPWHLAIGTDGAFPGLARMLREVLEQLLPEDRGASLADLAVLRQRLRATLPGPDQRQYRLKRLVNAFRRTSFLPEERP